MEDISENEERNIYACYGVLFNKIMVGESRFIFKAVNLLRGHYDSDRDMFYDELKMEYDIMSNLNILWNSDCDVVGCVISEDSLLDAYPGKNIDEAKSLYYLAVYSNLYYGTVDNELERISFCTVPYSSFDSVIEQGSKSKNIQSYDYEYMIEYGEDGDMKMLLDPDLVRKLANSDNFDDVKKILNTAVKDFEEIALSEFNLAKDLEEKIKDHLKEKEVEEEIDITNPYDVFGFDFDGLERKLNQIIIGQPDAIEAILSAIAMDKFATRTMDKNRMLLYGPTGVGKTGIFEAISEELDIPMIIVDSSQLTPAGYVGSDLSDVLKRLIQKANGDIIKAQRGIILFDEIDKKAKAGNMETGGEFFKNVLDSLLKFLESNEYEIHDNKYRSSDSIHFNTENLIIAVSGTFTHIIDNKKKNRQIGFGTPEVSDFVTPVLDEDDFKEGGIDSEFLGRLPVKIRFNSLSQENLMDILENSPISALNGQKQMLTNIGLDLTWDMNFIEGVAALATKKKTGARSLKGIIENVILKAKIECMRNLGLYNGMRLTKDSVEDHRKVILVDLNNVEVELGEILDSRIKDSNGNQKVKIIQRIEG